MVQLDTLTEADLPSIVEWRKADPGGARTPYDLSIEQEREWFEALQYRDSHHRYWALRTGCVLVGLSGLTNIEWENGRAEVALLVDPTLRGKGIGSMALRQTFAAAFERMRLYAVYGEVYTCNKYLGFWEAQIGKYGADTAKLPGTKWWDGERWDSLWFQITEAAWKQAL